MVINFGGSIVPSEDSIFRMQTGESDEVFGLGNVNRLLVNPGRDSNDRTASVAEWNGVYCFLYGSVVTGAVLRYSDHYGHLCVLLMGRNN